MTPRKATVLALQLPSGAQTWVECGFDSAWTLADYLSAATFDALNVGNWQRAGDAKKPRPKPIPRPADARKSVRAADRNERMALRLLERKRAAQQPQDPQEV